MARSDVEAGLSGSPGEVGGSLVGSWLVTSSLARVSTCCRGGSPCGAARRDRRSSRATDSPAATTRPEPSDCAPCRCRRRTGRAAGRRPVPALRRRPTTRLDGVCRVRRRRSASPRRTGPVVAGAVPGVAAGSFLGGEHDLDGADLTGLRRVDREDVVTRSGRALTHLGSLSGTRKAGKVYCPRVFRRRPRAAHSGRQRHREPHRRAVGGGRSALRGRA